MSECECVFSVFSVCVYVFSVCLVSECECVFSVFSVFVCVCV
jgi:hypothetical protein